MKFSIMTFSITIFSIMTFSVTTFSIMTFSTTTHSITICCTMTLSIIKWSNVTQHNNKNETLSKTYCCVSFILSVAIKVCVLRVTNRSFMPNVIRPSVVMLSVVAP
jgi:hypothetical protein